MFAWNLIEVSAKLRQSRERRCLVGDPVWDAHHPLWRHCKRDEHALAGLLPFRGCRSQTILQWISFSQSASVVSTKSSVYLAVFVFYFLVFLFVCLFSFKLILSSTSFDLPFPVLAFTAFYDWTLNVSNAACHATTPAHRVGVLWSPFPKKTTKTIRHFIVFKHFHCQSPLAAKGCCFSLFASNENARHHWNGVGKATFLLQHWT